jgi:hypothetical protein
MTEPAQNDPLPALPYYHDRSGAQFASARWLILASGAVTASLEFVSHVAVLCDPRHRMWLRFPLLQPDAYFTLILCLKLIETAAAAGMAVGCMKLLSNDRNAKPITICCTIACMAFEIFTYLLHIRVNCLDYAAARVGPAYALPPLIVIELSDMLYSTVIPAIVLTALLRRDLQPDGPAH